MGWVFLNQFLWSLTNVNGLILQVGLKNRATNKSYNVPKGNLNVPPHINRAIHHFQQWHEDKEYSLAKSRPRLIMMMLTNRASSWIICGKFLIICFEIFGFLFSFRLTWTFFSSLILPYVEKSSGKHLKLTAVKVWHIHPWWLPSWKCQDENIYVPRITWQRKPHLRLYLYIASGTAGSRRSFRARGCIM